MPLPHLAPLLLMPYDSAKLYALLPAIDRIRDAERGEPLRALLAAIAEQVAVLEEDLAQLYDDQFIETCADWVVPYIGDLIEVRTLHGNIPAISSPRSEVANTIAYRRRKGTATMLEQLARDVTGWDARVVEFFQWLSTTQYMQHIRPFRGGTLDLRHSESCDRVTNTGGTFETTDLAEVLNHASSTMRGFAGAFNTAAHTADVRRIASGRGQFNIPNIGVFLWRLTAYPIKQGTARLVDAGYTFHPLGMDAPLFNDPQPETEITHLADPINVSEPLRRRPLYDELERLRQALVDGLPEAEALLQNVYFGDRLELQPFRIVADGVEIPAREVLICNLSEWRRSPSSQTYRPQPTPTEPEPAPQTLPIQVAVDPKLGRLTFPQGVSPEQVRVSYAYGFSADMGGGSYSRPQAGTPTQVVSTGGLSLVDALTNTGTNDGVIEIADSTTITGNFTLALSAGQQLTIRSQDGVRSVIDGAIAIVTAADADITLDGLLIAQGIQITGIDTITLTLRHCTLAPWLELESGEPRPLTNPAIDWQATGDGRLTLDRTITGRLVIHPSVEVAINNGIVDALADDRTALAANEDGVQAAGVVKIVRTTVLGQIHVSAMELVENSILTGIAISDRTQTGCVRFSYLPPGSKAPRRYRCQPDLALAEKAQKLKLKSVESLPATEREAIQTRLIPQFTSRRYSHPGYCQLSQRCAVEIRRGADDESEMGAFHDLFQPQRETNLRVRFDEYLRFGLEAGIIYVT